MYWLVFRKLELIWEPEGFSLFFQRFWDSVSDRGTSKHSPSGTFKCFQLSREELYSSRGTFHQIFKKSFMTRETTHIAAYYSILLRFAYVNFPSFCSFLCCLYSSCWRDSFLRLIDKQNVALWLLLGAAKRGSLHTWKWFMTFRNTHATTRWVYIFHRRQHFCVNHAFGSRVSANVLSYIQRLIQRRDGLR